MAACGGLEHIFEKPLSETPTFLESLSSWKHIKSIDDSSYTEIFGDLHFKESHAPSSSSSSTTSHQTADSHCREREAYKHNESFSLCTEGLGFESFDECNKEGEDGDGDIGDGERNLARNSGSHRNEAAWRVSRGEYPPPISCIGSNGKPWVCLKSYREDGRFILKEIRIPTQELLHACRRDGRLKLQFVQSDDDDEIFQDEVDDEDVDEEQMEDRRQIEGEDEHH